MVSSCLLKTCYKCNLVLASYNCQSDSVTIFEGSENGTSKGEFCGHTAPEPITTQGSMMIRFVTSGYNSDNGWKATFARSGKKRGCELVCCGYLYLLTVVSKGTFDKIISLKFLRISVKAVQQLFVKPLR